MDLQSNFEGTQPQALLAVLETYLDHLSEKHSVIESVARGGNAWTHGDNGDAVASGIFQGIIRETQNTTVIQEARAALISLRKALIEKNSA